MKTIKEEPLASYQLIDYNKTPSVLPPRYVDLTASEAHSLNYAFALNNTTKRYIKQ